MYHASNYTATTRQQGLYISRCLTLRLSQHAIRKYGRHIGRVIMSDDGGSIMANHNKFAMSLRLYYLWYYYDHFTKLFVLHL